MFCEFPALWNIVAVRTHLRIFLWILNGCRYLFWPISVFVLDPVLVGTRTGTTWPRAHSPPLNVVMWIFVTPFFKFLNNWSYGTSRVEDGRGNTRFGNGNKISPSRSTLEGRIFDKYLLRYSLRSTYEAIMSGRGTRNLTSLAGARPSRTWLGWTPNSKTSWGFPSRRSSWG
jgi:hypothetical protein